MIPIAGAEAAAAFATRTHAGERVALQAPEAMTKDETVAELLSVVDADPASWTQPTLERVNALLDAPADRHPLYGWPVGGVGVLDDLRRGDVSKGSFQGTIKRALQNGFDSELSDLRRHAAALRIALRHSAPTEAMTARARELFAKEPRDLTPDEIADLRLLVLDVPRPLRPDGHNYLGSISFGEAIDALAAGKLQAADAASLDRHWKVYQRSLDPAFTNDTVVAIANPILQRHPSTWSREDAAAIATLADHVPIRARPSLMPSFNDDEASRDLWNMADGAKPTRVVLMGAADYRIRRLPGEADAAIDRLNSGATLADIAEHDDFGVYSASRIISWLVREGSGWELNGVQELANIVTSPQISGHDRKRIAALMATAIEQHASPAVAAEAHRLLNRIQAEGLPEYAAHGELRALVELTAELRGAGS